ncbi:hypothetical protein JY742_10100 [Clostridioides difficile]|nr:hypothetical protein [Clostridioides difficile]
MVKEEIFKSRSISLKAKGLYGTISAFKDESYFSKQFLMDYLDLGAYAFRMAWNELKDKGYLEVNKKFVDGAFVYEYKLH